MNKLQNQYIKINQNSITVINSDTKKTKNVITHVEKVKSLSPRELFNIYKILNNLGVRDTYFYDNLVLIDKELVYINDLYLKSQSKIDLSNTIKNNCIDNNIKVIDAYICNSDYNNLYN